VVSAYVALELRRSLRDGRYVGLVVAWPVAAYLLFSTVFGGAADRAEGLGARTEIMVAMAAFGAIGAVLMATGPRMAAERQSGWTRQLRVTPLPAWRLLAARLVAALALTLPAIGLTFVVAAARGVGLGGWEWPALAALLVVGSVPFGVLGLLIGASGSGEAAMGLTTAVYVALAALGGLWMPVRILPSALRTLAGALPSYRLGELGWRVAAGRPPTLSSVVVLAAWTVGLGALALLVGRRVAS
jgi:ABC-2 type transport system permease protein